MTQPAKSGLTYVCGGCGAHLDGLGIAHSCAAEIVGLRADVDRLREAVTEYVSHQSWRCDHPDRYPHEPDCPCGLVAALRGLGFDPEIAGP
jgi:hypothetical protein